MKQFRSPIGSTVGLALTLHVQSGITSQELMNNSQVPIDVSCFLDAAKGSVSNFDRLIGVNGGRLP